MRPPMLRLSADEEIVDCFAGGGGASLGIELATGRKVTIAINHDPEAVAMHKVNHPETEHYTEVDPVVLVKRNGHAKRLSATAQVEKCGNSVCPPIACAIVRSVFSKGGAIAVAA